MFTSISTSKRPVPLIRRLDLIEQDMVFRGERYRAVKDPLALKYYHLQPEQYIVLDYLDGKNSLEETRICVQKYFPMHYVTASDVQSLILDLHRKGLVQSNRRGQPKVLENAARKKQWTRFAQTVLNPLFIKFPGWNFSLRLEKLNRWIGWIFSWPAIMVALVFVAGSWIQLGVRYQDLQHKIPAFEQFFAWRNTVYLWLTIGLTKLIHELGHGIACKRFGCQCHSIGVALLVFSPTMYCDATDSWMLSNKWKRIAIAAAGMYVEVVLSAIAIFAWSILQPGLLEKLCLNIFFVSTFSTVVFNANPLIKFDGYYILSDWLEIPNLREKSQLTIRQWIAMAFGLKLPRNPLLPKSGRFFFGFYAIASTLYSWTIIISIGIGMYEMLKPYELESAGAVLGILVVLSSLVGIGSNTWKTIQSARDEKIQRRRFLGTSILLAILLVALILMPFPIHIRAPFSLEPHKVHNISVVHAGTIQNRFISEGQTVIVGQLILEIENVEVHDRVFELRNGLKKLQVKLEVHHYLDEDGEFAVTEDSIRRIEEELQEWEAVLKSLVVVSPCDGTILAAARQQAPDKESFEDQLCRWTGNPLSPNNQGAFLEMGTSVCQIAEDTKFDAIVLLEQQDRQDVRVDQRVRLLCEAFPHHTLSGRVIGVSQRHLEFSPRNLSNKLGGELPTITDSKGRERLSSDTYQIRIAIEPTNLPLKFAMRGHAKVLVFERSVGQWAWRFLCRTFMFRL